MRSDLNHRNSEDSPSSSGAVPSFRRATLTGSTLFILLLSGPPPFRVRDPEESLRGQLDISTMIEVVVWALAAAWIVSQLWDRPFRKELFRRLGFIEWAALGLIACLVPSIFVSPSPAMSTFKIGQIAVLLLFALIFATRHGPWACFERLLLGNLLLCGAIVVSFAISPDLVADISETGAMRLRGTPGVAETAVVGVFSVILLILVARRRMSLIVTGPLIAFSGAIVLFSLARSAYLALAAFLVLFVFRESKSKAMKWLLILAILAGTISLVTGAVPLLNNYRNPEGVSTVGDRLGLWAFFIGRTITESPWIGLGYSAGTRVTGMEFNPELGAGHSIFFEVFVGGGLISLCVFLILIGAVSWRMFQLFKRKKQPSAFVAVSLYLVVIFNGVIGSSIDTGQVAFTLWLLLALLPLLRSEGSRVFARDPLQISQWLRPSLYPGSNPV